MSSYEQWNFWILSRTGKTTSIEFLYGISHIFRGVENCGISGATTVTKSWGKELLGFFSAYVFLGRDTMGTKGGTKKCLICFPDQNDIFRERGDKDLFPAAGENRYPKTQYINLKRAFSLFFSLSKE